MIKSVLSKNFKMEMKIIICLKNKNIHVGSVTEITMV